MNETDHETDQERKIVALKRSVIFLYVVGIINCISILVAIAQMRGLLGCLAEAIQVILEAAG